MEKLDVPKKHQNNLEEDSVMFYQKETKELADLLQKGNTNITRKLTRIPFYRLEKLKKIEEEKLKNIHKTEKKEKKDLTKVGKGHDYHQVERRRYKKTKKQKELIHQNVSKETQMNKEKEINNNFKENNKTKNINVKTENIDLEKDKKKTKLNTLNINSSENNINLAEHKNVNTKNNNNILSRNYSDYFHDLKYAPSSIKYSRKELRMSKKQQKIQFPEYTLGHFLGKEDKNTFSKIEHRLNYNKKNEAKKQSNNGINKNTKINSKNEKSEKVIFSGLLNKHSIKKVNSEKKINNIILLHNLSSNDKNNENKLNIIPSSDNINKKLFNDNNIIKDENKIIKEDIENENEIERETEPKKHGNLKLLKKKHKRMNKYKKAILKYRLEKKKAFCDAVERDKEQMFFSNTFNADESINNVINSVLNQNINPEETLNNNNNITNNSNEYSYNLSIISENKNQDNIQDSIQNKSQINNEVNMLSPILSHKNLESNNQNNSILNYYSYNYGSNNITHNSYNKIDISPQNNISENNNISNNNLNLNSSFPNFQSGNNCSNNNYINNNSNINAENTYYINNNVYNYYYPYPPYQMQYNNYNYLNNINNVNNNIPYNNKQEITINNSLPQPKSLFNPELPTIKLKLKKEKEKEKKLNNYIENLKKENSHLVSLNINSMNGKELTTLLEENKDIDKIDLSLINLLLPKEQANSFVKKYAGISKVLNNHDNNNAAKKPIREYVDQILDKNFEKIFSDFIEKLRDLYYKKKSVTPLKAKKRFVVGMREIEKSIKLKNIMLLFVVPYIEKVEGEKNSLDQRILDIFDNCRKNEIPIFFGLNKYKLGQIARKKISAISMLGIINVEGMENELKNLIKIGNELRKKWYVDNYEKKENLKDNKFIEYKNFEYFHNIYLAEELQKNKKIQINKQ